MPTELPQGPDTAPSLSAAALARYSAALSRYLARRRVRADNVADMTQEIFELFLRHRDRTETIRNPLAYLYRIASHVIGDAVADERQSPVRFDSQTLEDLPADVAGSSGEDVEELAVRNDVLAALEKLPENYLTALLLVEGQGMSYKQAAQASGFSPNTIAMYVMRGRAALKLALDERWSRETRG